ncbi:membrane protein [Agarivorans sp. Toyoura001]|uniref:DMT family transporter n=1 Tax=Agarivorans sp. Toyoura001 TaxID=2283141 RepID=UPI0010F37D5F|nr:DMT family transporter [Agarivorans sp. Toyoura001]GDY26200.1 membrane protein [Agarivorans sp. Toyoura001]
MDLASVIRLLLLSAIWGSSFLFMRIAAPVLGPGILIELRVGFAALFLMLVGFAIKKQLKWREHWRHYMILGLFNSALPFLLLAYAAQTLSASLLSILNATAPIWGAIISALWLRQAMPFKKVLGLVVGIAGVAILVGVDSAALSLDAKVAISASIGAAVCYGIASTYAHSAKSVEPFANAHGGMWASTLLVAPAMLFFPIVEAPSANLMLSVVFLGVVCSGVAYLLYYRLISDVGASSALTVTFLIPVFGILWGSVFLNEAVSWNTLLGTSVILVGTALVTGFSPRTVFAARQQTSR